MASRFAYLSDGKLYLKNGDSPAVLYESPFARGIRDRAVELQRRHSWKTGGSGERLIPRAALWGANAGDAALVRIDFNSVCAQGATPGFVYSIRSREISGVLAHQEESGAEFRLLHTSDYRVSHISSNPVTGKLVMSIQHIQGATLAVMEANGAGLTEVTQGESSDECPAWVDSGANEIVFQSAGLAHNEDEQVVGMAPYSIQLLNVESYGLQTLLESPHHDLLAPRLTKDGTLYFIRRPYKLNPHSFNFWRLMEDVLLFPYRLLYAFYQYLNFFTMRYTGNPLSASGASLRKQVDKRRMILWGNLLEAQRKGLGDTSESLSMVPSTWELCRKRPGADIEVLAKSVLSFDYWPDETLLFSNGFSVFQLFPSGQKVRLLKANMIQQVVSLGEAPILGQHSSQQEHAVVSSD